MNVANATKPGNSTLQPWNSSEFTTNDTVLITLKALIFCTALVGNALNILLIIALVLQKGRHVNIRILMANISLAAVVYGFVQVIKSVYFFAYVGQDGRFSATALDCVLQETVPGSAARAGSFAIVGAAVERYLATRYHATYEHKSFVFGVGFSVFAWLQAVCWSIASILLILTSGKSSVQPYCANIIAGNSYLVGATVLILFFCTFGSVVAFRVLYRMNKRLMRDFNTNQLNLTLSSRLQLKHSIELTLNLMPCVILHAVVRPISQVYGLFMLGLTATWHMNVRVNMATVSELINVSYYLLHAMLVLGYSRSLQEIILEAFLIKIPLLRERGNARLQKLQKADTVFLDPATDEAKVYFQHLASAWQCEELGDSNSNSPSSAVRQQQISFKRGSLVKLSEPRPIVVLDADALITPVDEHPSSVPSGGRTSAELHPT